MTWPCGCRGSRGRPSPSCCPAGPRAAAATAGAQPERAFAAAGMTVQGAAAVFAALNASRAAAGQPAHATIQAEQPVGEDGGAEGEEYGEDGAEAEGEAPLAESAVQLDPLRRCDERRHPAGMLERERDPLRSSRPRPPPQRHRQARDKKMLIRHVRHGAKAPARTGTDALPDVWVLSRAHVYTRGVGKVILS